MSADQSQTPEATPDASDLVRPTPGGTLGRYLRAVELRRLSDELARLRRIEAAAKVLRVETFGRAHNDEDIEAAWDALKDALDGAALEEKP